MKNKALIEHAKQTMKDLFELSGGKMLEHEQNAYNCLRLFCIKLEKIESVKDIVCLMEETAVINMSNGESLDLASFSVEEGVLITNGNAFDVYKALFEFE